jgi:hypothetical protein
MTILNLNDQDKVATQNSDAIEKKRLDKVKSINKAREERQAQVEVAEAQRRVDEQARMKNEVKSQYLAFNLWASEKDFEQSWKDDKERLIREHRMTLANVPRM